MKKSIVLIVLAVFVMLFACCSPKEDIPPAADIETPSGAKTKIPGNTGVTFGK